MKLERLFDTTCSAEFEESRKPQPYVYLSTALKPLCFSVSLEHGLFNCMSQHPSDPLNTLIDELLLVWRPQRGMTP
ncbi:hypothetical protein [uncultured Roseivirga sp.]|uniref:hypothetical protein n=1 Tax=uncultured Roseivirga sp. TaxID=543088 RepID=UPI00258BE356|nr:hypothetical protein [uncultured Roseivirga sp.]